jgi:hypothetical protein
MGVSYLAPEERKQYEVTFAKNQKGQISLNRANGTPFDTAIESTHFSGAGTAIFVISADGKMYSGSHRVGDFHHSSFLAGSAVLGAGEIKTNTLGEIVSISNKSGHYQPDKRTTVNMLRKLEKEGIDLGKIEFQDINHASPNRETALTYLRREEKSVPSLVQSDDGWKVSQDSIDMLFSEAESLDPRIKSQALYNMGNILADRRNRLPNEAEFYQKISDNLNSQDPYISKMAMWALEQRPPTEPEIHLKIALNLVSRDPEIRKIAVKLLEQIKPNDLSTAQVIAGFIMHRNPQMQEIARDELIKISLNTRDAVEIVKKLNSYMNVPNLDENTKRMLHDLISWFS